jgi:predicted  nucleic acid-binding Zn-ribbon protein
LPSGGDEYAEIRVGRIQLPENEYSPEFVELLRKMIHPDVHARLSAAQLLRQPLLQTRDARKYLSTKAKKRKLKEEVANKSKELVQLQLELQMARAREQTLARELARVQELNSNSMEQKLAEMYAMMQKSLSIQK